MATGLDLTALRSMVRTALGTEVNETTDATVDQWLNRSWWDILNRMPFKENETFVPFTTLVGQRLYALPVSFEAVRSMGIEADGLNLNQHQSLNPWTEREYENAYNSNEFLQSMPCYYVREGNCIKLFPTPDKVYTITLYYWINLADLSDPALAPIVPRSWHEVIGYGAIWRGWTDLNDWTRGQVIREFTEGLINGLVPVESKEQMNWQRARTPVLGNPYIPRVSPFGYDPRSSPLWEFTDAGAGPWFGGP